MIDSKKKDLEKEIKYFRERFSKVDEDIKLSSRLSSQSLMELLDEETDVRQYRPSILYKMGEILANPVSRRIVNAVCAIVIVFGLSLIFLNNPGLNSLTSDIKEDIPKSESRALKQAPQPMIAQVESEESTSEPDSPESYSSPIPDSLSSYPAPQDAIVPVSYQEVLDALQNVQNGAGGVNSASIELVRTNEEMLNALSVSSLSKGESKEIDLGQVSWVGNELTIQKDNVKNTIDVPKNTDYVLFGAKDIVMVRTTDEATNVAVYDYKSEEIGFEYSQQGKLYDCVILDGEILLLTTYKFDNISSDTENIIPKYWDYSDIKTDVLLEDFRYMPSLDSPNFMVISNASKDNLKVKAILGNKLSAWCDVDNITVSVDSSSTTGEVFGSTISMR